MSSAPTSASESPTMSPQINTLGPSIPPQTNTLDPTTPQTNTLDPTMSSAPTSPSESSCPGGFELINSNCTISESFEEIMSSNKWRIWAAKNQLDNENVWDVNDLAFYDTHNCMGSKLNYGQPIESGHYSDSYVPANAFDGNTTTRWGGDEDEDGLLWLGMEFDILTQINCISILDVSGRGVTELRVQAWKNNTATWRNALISKNLVSGQRTNITLRQRTNVISHCPMGFELRNSVCIDTNIPETETESISVDLVLGILAAIVALVVICTYFSWKWKCGIYVWWRKIQKSKLIDDTSNSLELTVDTDNIVPPPSTSSLHDTDTDETTECVICLANKKNILFLPCRHLCTCQDCSTDIKQCPICRGDIEDKITAFN